MRERPRGSEEPGDQILDHAASDTPADASSAALGRTLDQQTDAAGGRWSAPAAPASGDRAPDPYGRDADDS